MVSTMTVLSALGSYIFVVDECEDRQRLIGFKSMLDY